MREPQRKVSEVRIRRLAIYGTSRLRCQGLTSADENEKTQLMKTLLTTDAGKRLMHEGFDSNDPEKFTRDWFAWANSLFALYAMEYCEL